MAGGDSTPGSQYSNGVAYIYIFNLIVGVGALNLPAGFQAAGLITGLILLAVVGFLAFVTVTWTNEVQASANAVKEHERLQRSSQYNIQGSPRDTQGTETSPLLAQALPDEEKLTSTLLDSSYFDIKEKVEVGEMSELFLGSIGQKIFYAIMIIYLYGDLAIYAVTVPLSLTTATGGWNLPHGQQVSEHDVYYIYLAFFTVFIVPWALFNFQKTKYLQILTLAVRNISLTMMIVLSLIFVGQGHGANPKTVPYVDIVGLPALFGVSVYAFMCHHSLPGIVTPISDKKHLNRLLAGDFITIYIVYAGVCVGALFAFGDITNPTCVLGSGIACKIQSLYTLNFTYYPVKFIAYFLTLFPVFTLSSNFPLIAITLRNNLMALIPYKKDYAKTRQVIFSLVATLPPLGIAFATRDVKFLVGFTGSYAGLGIMFFIPGCLLLFSKRKLAEIEKRDNVKFSANPHGSPFAHKAWIITVFVACFVSLVLITVNHIIQRS